MRTALTFLLMLFAGLATAAPPADSARSYPQDYFMFPIKPGQVNSLTGSMGEIRSNHFHAGIDVRTDRRIGLPVYAAADGHVYRIKASSYGYGNTIYVRHPNGLATVYAHLDAFADEIGDYLREEQYRQEEFAAEVFPPPGALTVRRGEVIGRSGNSGSSGGPHLHFEIRDSAEAVLDPLRFGFSEVRDTRPPEVTRLLVRPLDIGARVDGAFAPYTVRPTASGGRYTADAPVPVYGTVGLELEAFDRQSDSWNKNGVTCVEVELDGEEVFSMNLQRFTFDETRHINRHIDYEGFRQLGVKRMRCYVADGNALRFYHTGPKRGRIQITDTLDHRVTITLWDTYQNARRVTLTLRGTPPSPVLDVDPLPTSTTVSLDPEVAENTLRLTATNLPGGSQPAVFFTGRERRVVPAAYAKGRETVFLYDLRTGLPDSVAVGDRREPFSFRATVLPGQYQRVRFGDLQFEFPPEALYDTLYLTVERTPDGYRVGPQHTPLHREVAIRWVPPAADTNLRVYRYGRRNRTYFEGGHWQGDTLTFETRYFGQFTTGRDNTSPEIKALRLHPDGIRFSIRDRDAGVASFRATLDGQWVLMNYDHKRALLWSDRRDARQRFRGQFVLEVTDQAGNVETFQRTL